jgi:hypothetical protein
LVYRVDEREDAVATVDEPVTVLPADARLEQRGIEYLVQLGAKLGLHRIGPAGRALDIQGDYGPMTRQPGGPKRIWPREHARH